MAITGDALLVNLRYTFLGQKCQTGQFYTPGGAAFITANCDGVGEAWWNDVKTAWRAMLFTDVDNFTFDSVVVEEFNGSDGLGEFAVPAGERAGTRAVVTTDDILPSYCAVGVRLTVPTRATRPGQKRFPGLTEGDAAGNIIDSGFITLVEAVVAKYDSTITLGAPVAAGTLTPKIVSFTGVPPTITAQQDVAGHVINGFLTSQVSRRRGHGS